jgi:carbon storage regulator
VDQAIRHNQGKGFPMLILTRKSQQSVVIGGANGFERLLKVTVLDISAGRVRLGFEVAADVPVHRLEVWERIRDSEQANGPTVQPSAPREEPDGGNDDGGKRDGPTAGFVALDAS